MPFSTTPHHPHPVNEICSLTPLNWQTGIPTDHPMQWLLVCSVCPVPQNRCSTLSMFSSFKIKETHFCIPPSFSPTAPAPGSLVLSSDRLSLDSTGWSGTGNLPASASQTLTHFLKAWGKQYKMKLPIGRILRSYRFLNPVISVVNQGLCVLKQSLGYSFCQAWFEKHHTRTHSSRSAGLESWGVEAWGGGGGGAGGGLKHLQNFLGDEGTRVKHWTGTA